MANFRGIGLAIGALALGSLGITASAHADDAAGASAFQRCAACHLADGAGVPGSFPPLAGRLGGVAGTDAGREYLVMVVKSGLMGALEVDGITYRGVMPAQGAALDDAAVAALLNYAMTEFNADGLSADWMHFTAEEVAAIAARHPGANPMSVYKLRAAAFAAGEGM